MRLVFLFLFALFLSAPLSAGLAADPPDPHQLDQARLADIYTAKSGDQAQPSASKEAEKEMRTLTADFDKSGTELLASLDGKLQPWMWWAACGAWVLLVFLAGKLVQFALRRLFPGRHISWLGRIFRVFCYLICTLIAIFLFLLGFGAAALAAPVIRIEGKLILLAVAFGVADLALVAVNISIDRYVMSTDPSGQPLTRSPRVLTLLPLLRNIAMISLGTVLLLMVLGQFGVNIAPLLAGAGVIGVAVGFGSQKLVQDVITGAFMLFENTLAIGDTVQIGTHTGIVEGMTIRTLRLRDSNGQLHTLPFSSVSTVINMSRDFGFHNFELHISYDTSIDRAIEVIAETVTGMQSDPAMCADILAPADIYGVNELSQWAVVLTGAIKTPPGRQYAVGRAFNRRIKEAFDRAGVKLAQPAQTVRIIK